MSRFGKLRMFLFLLLASVFGAHQGPTDVTPVTIPTLWQEMRDRNSLQLGIASAELIKAETEKRFTEADRSDRLLCVLSNLVRFYPRPGVVSADSSSESSDEDCNEASSADEHAADSEEVPKKRLSALEVIADLQSHLDMLTCKDHLYLASVLFVLMPLLAGPASDSTQLNEETTNKLPYWRLFYSTYGMGGPPSQTNDGEFGDSTVGQLIDQVVTENPKARRRILKAVSSIIPTSKAAAIALSHLQAWAQPEGSHEVVFGYGIYCGYSLDEPHKVATSCVF